jgi:hypothetical protein
VFGSSQNSPHENPPSSSSHSHCYHWPCLVHALPPLHIGCWARPQHACRTPIHPPLLRFHPPRGPLQPTPLPRPPCPAPLPRPRRPRPFPRIAISHLRSLFFNVVVAPPAAPARCRRYEKFWRPSEMLF